MATLRSIDLAVHPRALSSAAEQVEILRRALAPGPDDAPLEIEPGFQLEGWEHALLAREARFSRDVKGEALTLLHARAAELAVRRALGRGALDAAQAEAASLLLDRALADIGAAGEVLSDRSRPWLEAQGERLQLLYRRAAETSLGLAVGRGEVTRAWRLAELRDDEFAIEDETRAPAPRPVSGPEPSLDIAGADLFEVQDQMETAPAPSPAAAPAPGPVAPGPVAELRAEAPARPVAPAPARIEPRPQPLPAPSGGRGLWIGLAAAAVAIAVAAVAFLR